MVRTAVQLYTLRGLGESLPSLVRRVAGTAFDGVELAGVGETEPRALATVLEETVVDVAGAHVGAEALEDDPDAVAATYRMLDCDRLVVPYLDDGHFADEAAVRRTADRLESLRARLAERGFELGYHNHDHEFVALDGDDGGRTAFDALIDATDDALSIELDVGWAVAAGRDPVELLRRLEGRVPLVHLKDVADGEPVELGAGEVDVEACAAAARDAGAEWLIYEHDEPADPAASLDHGATALDALRG